MKLTLKEMNGLLNGKYLPSDLLTGETLADYLFRKFDEARQQLEESHRALRAETTAHENTQTQLEKMASENAVLKKTEPAPFSKLMMEALDVYQAGADGVPELAMLSAYKILRDGLKTPEADTFQTEVQAQDVDAAVELDDGPYAGTAKGE